MTIGLVGSSMGIRPIELKPVNDYGHIRISYENRAYK